MRVCYLSVVIFIQKSVKKKVVTQKDLHAQSSACLHQDFHKVTGHVQAWICFHSPEFVHCSCERIYAMFFSFLARSFDTIMRMSVQKCQTTPLASGGSCVEEVA